MTNVPRNRKKSNFVEETTIPAGVTFDFVHNGTNYKVPVEVMIAAFGTIGTLSQTGEVTATAILKQSGTSNLIRNIFGQSGITVGLGAQDGVQIDHNFTVDTTGVALMINEAAASPTFRSILGGTGINVSGSGNNIQIALTSAPVGNSTTVVNEMSDFPAAVSGVITLEDDTQYFITNPLSTAHRFVFGNNTVIRGSDSQVASLTYTGIGIMFGSVDSSNEIADIEIIATTGTFVGWIGTYGTGKQLILRNMKVTASNLGSIADCDGFSLTNCYTIATTDGFNLLGTNGLVSFADMLGTIIAGKLVDLDACTMDAFSFRNAFIITSAGTYIMSGLVDSGNIAAGNLGSVLNVRNIGAGTFLENITEKDSLWEFDHNDGAVDSINAFLATNAGTTVTIAAINTPVIIGATWLTDHESRFTSAVGGRWTYTGKGTHIDLEASITAEIASATDLCTFYVFKNGVQETNSAISRELSAGNPGNLSLIWQLDLATDDYIELFAENNDTTVNIVINNAIVKVH